MNPYISIAQTKVTYFKNHQLRAFGGAPARPEDETPSTAVRINSLLKSVRERTDFSYL